MSDLLNKLADLDENDIGNAERFIKRYGDHVMYVSEIGWHVWDGRRWKADPSEKYVRRLAQKTAKAIFDEVALAKDEVKRTRFAMQSGQSPRVTAMLKEAAPHLERTVEDLDRDLWLLNVQNGTLDLKSGILRDHEPSDYLTKLAPVVFDPKAKSPLLEQFLERVAPDQATRDYLQSFAGYGLTGTTGEQCLPFLHGMGANGKTTFLELLRHIMGNYAVSLPFSSLLHNDHRQGSAATPDLARLPGCRMVIATEPDFGSRFSEALLKSLTGGDTMAVRKLHKDFFEFQAQFKLWLAGNHKPNIRGNDEGIWRRIKMIPFEETIPVDERDADLPAKLWLEASGVLNWMYEGCRQWQENGLPEPDTVSEATQEYRNENDPIGDFFADCIVVDPKGHVRASDLRKRYEDYCFENGMQSVSQKALGQILKERGFTRKKTGVYFWSGLRLLDIEPSMVQHDYRNDGNNLSRYGD